MRLRGPRVGFEVSSEINERKERIVNITKRDRSTFITMILVFAIGLAVGIITMLILNPGDSTDKREESESNPPEAGTSLYGYPAVGIKSGVDNKTPGVQYRTTGISYECEAPLKTVALSFNKQIAYKTTHYTIDEEFTYDPYLGKEVQRSAIVRLEGGENTGAGIFSLIVQTDTTSTKDSSRYQDDYIVYIGAKPPKLSGITLNTDSFDYSDQITGITMCMTS